MGKLLDKLLRRKSEEQRDVCTIRRDRLDDHVAEEFEARSERFSEAINRAPEVDGKPVPHFPDLMRDVFKSFYTYDEPSVLDADDVREDHEANRRVMSRIVGLEDHQQGRTMTKHSEIEAAFSTLAMRDTLADLYENELSDLAQEQQQAAEAQDALDAALEAGDEETAVNAQRALEEAAANIESMGIPADAVAKIEQAVDDAQEAAQTVRWLPGVGRGNETRIPADNALRLAERFNTPGMRELAEMIGRLVPDMRSKRLQKTRHGREEIVDITLGNDLENILPSELVKLTDETLELDFMRRFYERALLQYEKLGLVAISNGHIAVCVDSSHSMKGAKHQWARAVVAAILAICLREKRDVVVIDYADAGELATWEFKGGKPLDTDMFMEMVEHFFAGGTDATPAIREAKRVIDTEPGYDRADIVLITDGEDKFEAEDAALREELTEANISVFGIMIGAHPTHYLTQMCDRAIPAYDLSGNNEATDMLATHV